MAQAKLPNVDTVVQAMKILVAPCAESHQIRKANLVLTSFQDTKEAWNLCTKILLSHPRASLCFHHSIDSKHEKEGEEELRFYALAAQILLQKIKRKHHRLLEANDRSRLMQVLLRTLHHLSNMSLSIPSLSRSESRDGLRPEVPLPSLTPTAFALASLVLDIGVEACRQANRKSREDDSKMLQELGQGIRVCVNELQRSESYLGLVEFLRALAEISLYYSRPLWNPCGRKREKGKKSAIKASAQSHRSHKATQGRSHCLSYPYHASGTSHPPPVPRPSVSLSIPRDFLIRSFFSSTHRLLMHLLVERKESTGSKALTGTSAPKISSGNEASKLIDENCADMQVPIARKQVIFACYATWLTAVEEGRHKDSTPSSIFDRNLNSTPTSIGLLLPNPIDCLLLHSACQVLLSLSLSCSPREDRRLRERAANVLVGYAQATGEREIVNFVKVIGTFSSNAIAQTRTQAQGPPIFLIAITVIRVVEELAIKFPTASAKTGMSEFASSAWGSLLATLIQW
mmetsp:Transcript_16540/g.23139  ORF Transcript_16540/g.23139 Transcript_16540/m.23139 type:complete len:515 (-) Transcript_16540:3541-5085(-)